MQWFPLGAALLAMSLHDAKFFDLDADVRTGDVEADASYFDLDSGPVYERVFCADRHDVDYYGIDDDQPTHASGVLLQL